MGPVIGGGLYALGGYKLPFYSFAGFYILLIPFLIWWIPGDVNEFLKRKNEKNEKKENEQNENLL